MFLKYIKEKFLGMFSNDSMVAFKIIEANINNDFISFILNTPGASWCYTSSSIETIQIRNMKRTCYTLYEHTSTIPIIDWYSDYIEYLLSKYLFSIFFFSYSVFVCVYILPLASHIFALFRLNPIKEEYRLGTRALLIVANLQN